MCPERSVPHVPGQHKRGKRERLCTCTKVSGPAAANYHPDPTKRGQVSAVKRLIPSLLVCLSMLAAVPSAASGEGAVTFAGSGQVRGDLGPIGSDPRAGAAAAIRSHAGRLGVDADRFTFDSVRRSIVGLHVRGRELRGGVPVEDTSAAVHAVSGRIVQIDARGSDLPGDPSPAPVAEVVARGAALSRLGVLSPLRPPVAERLLVADGGRLVDVWRVSLVSLTPAVVATVDVGASDGRVVDVRDERVFLEGQATVFDPNPIVTHRDASLRQPGVDQFGVDTDLPDARLNNALRVLPVRQVASEPADLVAGRLHGPYVDVYGPGALDLFGGWFYQRHDPRFETLMAYTHIDRIQRYFQSLGFVGQAAINAEPQWVITHRVEGFDNSFYQPGNDLILYGAGGVDDAEDAEVVLHELGHAIHFDQVPNWGGHHQAGAMGEGFGDFLAAAYYAGSISGGFQDACVADWDATSYSSANPRCLRRVDTAKKFPQNMTNSVHADGEIWSGFLWDLRELLKCPAEHPKDDPEWETDPECKPPRNDSQIQTDRVLKLLLASHEFLSNGATFGRAVAALRTAADALGRPEWKALVDQAATARGLPLNP